MIKKFKKLVTKVIRNIQTRNQNKFIDLLGDEYSYVKAVRIWQEGAGELQLIATHLMIEKTTKGNLSSEELQNYNEGITDFLNFLANCDKTYYAKDDK